MFFTRLSHNTILLLPAILALAATGCRLPQAKTDAESAAAAVIEQLPPGPPSDAPLAPFIVGHRAIRYAIRDREIGNVAWYRLKADYNAVLRGDLWPRVQWPENTRLAVPARFQQNACLIKGDDGAVTPAVLHGLRFSRGPNLLRPAARRVVFRSHLGNPFWLVSEKDESPQMQFRLSGMYLLCFSRSVIDEKPDDDLIQVLALDTYVSSLHAIIEIEPTFDITSDAASKILFIPKSSFVSITFNWENVTLLQRQDGNIEIRSGTGAAAIVPQFLAQKARYMINTLQWRPAIMPRQGSAEDLLLKAAQPRVTIMCRTPSGFDKITLRQTDAGWIVTAPDGTLYRAPQPRLIKELTAEMHLRLDTAHKK